MKKGYMGIMTNYTLRNGSFQVLVVDDNKNTLDILEDLLRLNGYNFVGATSGEDALSILQQSNQPDKKPIDLVLLDVMMPEMDGILTLEHIRSDSSLSKIPVLILTVKDATEDKILAFSAGADDYVTKPFDNQELLFRIKALLKTKRLLKQHRDEYTEFQKISKSILKKRNLDDVLEKILEAAVKTLNFQFTTISLVDQEKGIVQCMQGINAPWVAETRRDLDGSDILVDIVRKNRMEIIKGWDPRFHKPTYDKFGHKGLVRIFCPISTGNGVIGILEAGFESEQKDYINPDEARILEMLVDQAAIAIENARLFRETEQKTDELKVAHDHWDRLVTSSFDGIISTNSDGVIIGFNAMAEKILEYQAAEIIDSEVSKIYFNPTEPRKIGKLLHQNPLGKITDYNTELKNKNGDKIPICLSATWLFDDDSKRVGCAGFFRDMRGIQETELHRQMLLDASDAVAQADSLDQGLQNLARIMVKSCIATFCSILLYSAGGKRLMVKAAYPFPRSNRLVWDPKIGKEFYPSRKPEFAQFLNPNKPTVLQNGRENQESVLEHIVEQIDLEGSLNSALIIPLKSSEQNLGYCVLGEMRDWERSPFSERKIEQAQAITTQAAFLIEKMRAHELTQRRLEELETLQNLALTVSSSLDLDVTLQKVCQAAVELFKVEHSGLVRFDENLVEGEVVAEYPNVADSKGITFTLQDVPLEKHLINEKKPIVIDDVANEKALGSMRKTMYERLDIHSTVIVPVISRNKLIGSFGLDSIGHQRRFSSEEIDLCETFAAHVAIAVENARLYQETNISRERLQASFEASNTLISSQEPDQVLQDIVSQLQIAAGASWVSIILIDQSGQAKHLNTAGVDLKADIKIREDGISMQVFASSIAEAIEDVSQQRERVNPRMFKNKVAAALCLPMTIRGKQIGVTWAHYDYTRQFPRSEIEALQFYVNQAAIAYDNAQQMEELEHMHKATEVIAGPLDLREVLQQIANSAVEVLQAESSAIWSYDNVRNEFIPGELVVCNISDEILEKSRKLTPKRDGTAQTVMKKGWIGVTDTAGPNYDYMGPSTLDLLEKLKVKSFQGVVLKVGDENLGVLYVNYGNMREFSKKDRKTLETLANHAALALKKARLLDDISGALDQIKRAHNTARVVAELTALGNLKGTMDSVAKETCTTLACDNVTLYTYNETKDTFGFPPAMEGVVHVDKVLAFEYVGRESSPYRLIQLEDIYTTEDTPNDPIIGGEFTRRENVKATVGIPLIASGIKVGAMFANYCSPHTFSSDEITNIKLFANQAAVAIHNAQQFEEKNRYIQHQQAVYQASKVISAGFTSTQDELLDTILELVVDQISPVGDTPKATLGKILLYNENENKLAFSSIYPRDVEVKTKKGNWRTLNRNQGQIGITGRAVLEKKIQLVKDVQSDLDYIEIRPQTRSEIAIPLIEGSNTLGVLSLESDEPNAFDEDDKMALRLIAELAVIAIHNAQQYQELKITKGRFGASTTLAWLGMAESSWWHSTRTDAQAIIEQILLLSDDLEGTGVINEKLIKRFEMINRLANKIKTKPITSPLYSEQSTGSVSINGLIGSRTNQLLKIHPYNKVDFDLNLALSDDATVKANREWLRRAFDILVDNAVTAVTEKKDKRIEIGTRLVNNNCEILVADNGSGIPENIKNKIGLEVIEKPEDIKGLGIGLLIAQAIVQAYEGQLNCEYTGPNGTCMAICLPLEIN